MPLLIEARYPLGSYLGSDLGGDPEPYPSPARLHAAFLNAAGRGTTAEVTDAMTTPSPRAVVAVSWLEVHPPTAIEPPTMHWRPHPSPFIDARACETKGSTSRHGRPTSDARRSARRFAGFGPMTYRRRSWTPSSNSRRTSDTWAERTHRSWSRCGRKLRRAFRRCSFVTRTPTRSPPLRAST